MTRKHDPRYPDRTTTERSQKRRQLQADAASAVGFPSYSTAANALLAALRQPSIAIQLVTPLPCAVRECNHMATVAHAYPVEGDDLPGLWLVQPICRTCTLATAKNYE